MRKIGVLVVTYNQFDMMAQWIKRFREMFGDQGNICLLVLDNNSRDGSYSKLRRMFPETDIRKLKENYGCTTGRNIGILELDKLGCEFYTSCDTDVFIENERYFAKLSDAMNQNPTVDGFCPVLRWEEDNTIQGLGARRAWHGGLKTVREITGNRDVDCLPGGANFIRMSAFKKYGLYDNNLPPIGSQDYEWGLRARKLGAKFQYWPEVEAIHRHRKAAGCAPWTKKWVLMGRIIVLRKHFSLGNLIREISYAIFNVKEFGIREMVSAYWEGMKKMLDDENYNFEAFKTKGAEDYYDEEYRRNKMGNGR
ncbi:MAG: glycosyltransferase [Thermodesulfobacteriota bacterium]